MDNIEKYKKNILDVKKTFPQPEEETLRKRTPITLSQWKYMKCICKVYKVKLKIVKAEGDILGFYSPDGMVCIMETLNPPPSAISAQASLFWDTFIHELAHVIQHKTHGEKYTKNYEKEASKYEEEAVELARFLWDRYIGQSIPTFASFIYKEVILLRKEHG